MNETPLVICPMTLGEILDKAIRLYRQNFLTFIGIFAIPYIPMVVIQMVFSILYTTTMMSPDRLQSADPPLTEMGLGIATIIGSVVFNRELHSRERLCHRRHHARRGEQLHGQTHRHPRSLSRHHRSRSGS
ncbi:MAG: hypothetical protein U0V48_04680 [Anaerolineales bacterium]